MLDGESLRRWQQALLEVYDEAELRQMVRTSLDVELDAVAAGGDLAHRVYLLLTWADRHGQLDTLLGTVLSERPQLSLVGREVMEQRQLNEGNGVYRTVGQLEAQITQVHEQMEDVRSELRWMRWLLVASVLGHGVVTALLVGNIWPM